MSLYERLHGIKPEVARRMVCECGCLDTCECGIECFIAEDGGEEEQYRADVAAEPQYSVEAELRRAALARELSGTYGFTPTELITLTGMRLSENADIIH